MKCVAALVDARLFRRLKRPRKFPLMWEFVRSQAVASVEVEILPQRRRQRILWTSVTGNEVVGIAFFRECGTASYMYVALFFDSLGLPLTPNGGNVTFEEDKPGDIFHVITSITRRASRCH